MRRADSVQGVFFLKQQSNILEEQQQKDLLISDNFGKVCDGFIKAHKLLAN